MMAYGQTSLPAARNMILNEIIKTSMLRITVFTTRFRSCPALTPEFLV